MENLNIYEFEESNRYLAALIGLAISDSLLFLSHIITIIQIFLNKEKLDTFFNELSCIHIFAQLIFSSLFFCILHRTHLYNSLYLNISNLIGIALNLEWLCLYLYFYHIKKIIFAIIHMVLPVIFIIVILSLLLTIGEINKISEVVLINITMIFHIFMFLSPGLNIIKLFKTENHKLISITNSVLGIFVNLFMGFFIIMLNEYKIISISFIIYPIVSFIICAFLVIYYSIKFRKNKDLLDLDNKDDNTQEAKQFNLISNDSVEE